MSGFDINILKEKTEKSLNVLREELGTVRAGRANAALVDKVTVDYYGSPTPLKALSNISVPDPRGTLMISPFDPKSIPEIEHAINAANIGINPVNDGKVIRLQIPQVTEERRKELTKVVKKMGEDTKVAVRNLRRDANDKVKKMEKAGDFTEDDAKGTLDDIQKLIDKTIKDIDKIVEAKGTGNPGSINLRKSKVASCLSAGHACYECRIYYARSRENAQTCCHYHGRQRQMG